MQLRRTSASDVALYVTCYSLVKELLRDPRLGLAHPDPAKAPRLVDSPMAGPLAIDPESERHQRTWIRRSISEIANGRKATSWAPMVQRFAEERVQRFVASGPPGDFREVIATRFPLDVISTILGVDHAKEELHQLIWQADEPDAKIAMQAIRKLHGFFRRELEIRQLEPRKDLLSQLVADTSTASDGLNPDELVRVASTILIAGTVTPASMISHGLILLMRNRRYVQALRDPSREEELVDELLRFRLYFAPSEHRLDGGFSRYANQPLAVGDVELELGDLVVVDTRRANFDRDYIPDADVFCPRLQSSRHLTFGYGPGRCPGATLGAIEVGTILRETFRVLPDAYVETEPSKNMFYPGAQILDLMVNWKAT